ncbi:MAG: class D sortase [Candidatus Gracilibacteria bacterium]|jgi:LPXTG-site transpeptidase (sortase) family protein
METIRARIHTLALKLDRKILSAEEEDYVRLDLSAHEKVRSHLFAIKKPFKHLKTILSIKSFALTTALFFIALFVITNAAAYSKIAVASIKDFTASSETPTHQQILAADPWNGGKTFESIKEDPLAFATAGTEATQTNDGLPLFGIIPTPYDNRIEIPSLNISAPVIEPDLTAASLEDGDFSAIEEQIHETLLKGVVHYPGTAKPGEKGNMFLTGHSSNVFWEMSKYNTVFALLPKIKTGDKIIIYSNQNSFVYTVTEKKEVYPSDTSSLKQTDDFRLTLMTCTPVGTTFRRLIVTAELTP